MNFGSNRPGGAGASITHAHVHEQPAAGTTNIMPQRYFLLFPDQCLALFPTVPSRACVVQRAICSPDGGPPAWPGNAEVARSLESVTYRGDKGQLSIGSGFGFTFEPESPTSAVGEDAVRINTTADSPAARGTSGDNDINIDHDQGHGGATPSTPTPGIRRSLGGLQRGVQTGSSLTVGGAPPSTCFSPSIFDVVGGIEPTPLDDSGDSCDLSLSSELITVSTNDRGFVFCGVPWWRVSCRETPSSCFWYTTLFTARGLRSCAPSICDSGMISHDLFRGMNNSVI